MKKSTLRVEKTGTMNTVSSADSKDFLGYATSRHYLSEDRCITMYIFVLMVSCIDHDLEFSLWGETIEVPNLQQGVDQHLWEAEAFQSVII